jgi:dTMP kinase
MIINRNEKPDHPGFLIAFEGIDGTGKSTQIRLVEEKLLLKGHEVVCTREPTDGTYGRRIRQMFASRAAISRQEELDLFINDRREHVTRVIAPALAQGKIVLTDRYYLSTVAYQGAAGFDPEEILRLNAFAPRPDLAIILQIPPSLAVHRICNLRAECLNDFEQEEELAKVAGFFDRLPGDYIKRIDAARSIEDVHRDVWQQVEKLCNC